MVIILTQVHKTVPGNFTFTDVKLLMVFRGFSLSLTYSRGAADDDSVIDGISWRISDLPFRNVPHGNSQQNEAGNSDFPRAISRIRRCGSH